MSNTNVADNALHNDAFAIYADIDVVALQEAAIQQSKASDSAGRKETQMQVANILARYAQDRLLGDCCPTKLYSVQQDGSISFNVKNAKLLTRMIYDVAEKDEDGAKQALPQHLLARVRRIAPLVFYCVQHRHALVWDDKRKALAVPLWMTVADKATVDALWSTPESRVGFSKTVYLDGKDGRTLDSVVKRATATYEPETRGTNNTEMQSNHDKQISAFKAQMGNHGLEKTLEYLSEKFAAAPEQPFSDTIVELLAVCCEHINVRNGPAALGSAVAEMRPAKQLKKSAA